MNLQQTSNRLERIIAESRARGRKSICFVTGVPGAGKTLVGLNTAVRHSKAAGHARAPVEHVALFDEAQRAWDRAHTVDFMRRKKGVTDFSQSEPAFLISCMDRHRDWAVIVCLVGGGQEIHTGEAGIGGWLDAIQADFPHWKVYASPHLQASEYAADAELRALADTGRAELIPELHLSVSMRAFRAEKVSAWVKAAPGLAHRRAVASVLDWSSSARPSGSNPTLST